MKKFLITILTITALTAQAQYPMYSRGQHVCYSDPAVENIQFAGLANEQVNVNRLDVGAPVKMSFKLTNNDQVNMVPVGTCELKISLGSKFVMASNDLSQIANLPLTNYFQWSVAVIPTSGQSIITGKLINDLPANFSGLVDFTLLSYFIAF